jgi:cytochrome P450
MTDLLPLPPGRCAAMPTCPDRALARNAESSRQRLRVTAQCGLPPGDHEVVAAVLRDRPEAFARTSRLEEIWTEMGLPPGVFGANGEAWRRQRRMVMAAFDPGHVKAYYPALQRVADKLAARWSRAAADGRAVDLQGDLMRFTVDTIAGLAFGAEVDTLGSDGDVIQQHLDKIFPALARRILSPVAWWRIRRSAADRTLERGIVEVKAAVDGFVTQARARLAADPQRRERPHNLLEAMIVAADEPASGIDDATVAGNATMLAGEAPLPTPWPG